MMAPVLFSYRFPEGWAGVMPSVTSAVLWKPLRDILCCLTPLPRPITPSEALKSGGALH